MDAEKTGTLIYELRTKKNLTQKQLSELINVSDKAVSKWERGDGCPDVDMIPILAKVFDVDVETILNGRLPSSSQNLTGKNIKLYDFKRPDKWSRSDLRSIWNLFGKIILQVSSDFVSTSKSHFTINISSVDQLTNIEFAHSIPSTCFISEYSYNQGGFLIAVDSELGKALLKQDAAKYPEVENFDLDVMQTFFTDKIALRLEQAVDERLQSVNKDDSEHNNNSPATQFPFHRPFTSHTQTISTLMQPPYQMCMLVSLECETGGIKGFINFQFSDVYLNQLRKLGFFTDGYSEIQFEYLSDIKTPDRKEIISVEFGRFADTGINFEEGKVLVLNKKFFEPLNVVYKNKIIHTGEAVVIDENFGIRITDKVEIPGVTYDEEKYISVRLGTTLLLPDEIESLCAGSVLELNAIAGTPSVIIKDGQIVAHGEIVVCDDNFGIRITA